jgi:hypothetical protein
MRLLRTLALLAPLAISPLPFAAIRHPPVTIAAAAPDHGERQTLADWKVSYELPAGWQVAQRTERFHGLTTSAQGAVVYVAAGMYQSFNDIAGDLNKAFQALGLTGYPVGQPTSSTIRGMQAMTAEYAGQNQAGMPLRARVTAMLTPHGTGVVVTGIAATQLMAQVGTAVDQVARSVEAAGPPQPNPRAVAALQGRWMLYSGRAEGATSATGGASRSYEETVQFDGQGRFAWQSSASVSVTTPGMTGNAGGAQASSDEGTYTVIGSTLVVRGRQGLAAYEVQILADRIVADGKTYLRAN